MAKKLTNKEQSGLDYLDNLVNIGYLNVRKDRKSDSATVDFEGFADLNDIADALAAHDAEIRDKALSLTDDELAIAEGAYESSIMAYEGDGIGSMSIALKSVAADRRNHEHRNR